MGAVSAQVEIAAGKAGEAVCVTFRASEPAGLAALARGVSERIDRSASELGSLLDELAASEAALLDWLALAPANALSFLDDPLSAWRAAMVGVSEDALVLLDALSREVGGLPWRR